MSFDPDKYLAATAVPAFNPDAYLAGPTPAQREVLADTMASAMVSGNPMVPAALAKQLLTRGGRVGDIAAEVVPAMAGAVGGTFVTPGLGTAGGGAAGASAGNLIKQAREMVRGERTKLGKGELIASTVAGAIPVPGLKQAGTALATAGKIVAARGAQGGAIAGASETAKQVVDENDFRPKDIAKSTLIGTGLGAVFGGVEGGLAARRLLLSKGRVVDVPEAELPGALRAAADPVPPTGPDNSPTMAAPAAARPLESPMPGPDGGAGSAPNTGSRVETSPAQAPVIADGPGVPPAPGAKPLGLVESARSSPEVQPALASQLEGFYTPQSHAEAAAAAAKQLDEFANLDAAKAAVVGNRNPDAVGHALGLELMRKFQAEGRLQDAADVIYDMAVKAKTQGQAISILRTLSRSSPEGVATYASKLLNRKLDPKELDEISKAMKRIEATSDETVRLARQAQLMERLNSKVPAGWDQKLAAVQNMALLLNPKTIIRNLGGNQLMAAKDMAVDTIAPIADMGVSVFTGQRSVAGPQIAAYFKGLLTPAREAAAGYRVARSEGADLRQALGEGYETMRTLAKLSSGGKYEIGDVTKAYRHVFSNPYGKAVENGLTTVLGVPDRAFYMARFEAARKNLMRAADEAVPSADTLDRAHLEAMRSVYQDENFLSSRMNDFRRMLNFGPTRKFGLGQVVMPFTQVPGSILLRGIETSPLGFVKAFGRVGLDKLAGRNFNQREFVQSFSNALLGTTALAGTGYWLAKMGVIGGVREEDKDAEALRNKLGLTAYQINVSALKRMLGGAQFSRPQPLLEGDVLVSYDWAQPVSMPVALGADLAESEQRRELDRKAGRPETKRTGDVMNALLSGAKTLEEQPLIQGLTGFARNLGQHGPIEGVYRSALELPQAYTPTILRQAQALHDNRVFETRGSDAMETAYGRVAANLPGMAERLGFKPRYDVLGDLAERYQAGGNDYFNVLINPAFVQRLRSDPETAELYRLWKTTGERDMLPRVVDQTITINGQPKVLTAPERSDYQQMVGRLTRDAYRLVMRNEAYRAMDDAKRAEVLAKFLSAANEAAKIELFGNRPARPSELGVGLVLRKRVQERVTAAP
jgi:hypothetical protein